MLHIFLLILKIIGILLLVIIALALLILFYPITYKIQGSKSDKDYQLSIKAHWLLRFVSYKGVISNDGNVSKLRIFFVPIDFLKKKQKKQKKQKNKISKSLPLRRKNRVSNLLKLSKQ